MNKTAEGAVRLYLDACYEGSAEKIREVFHEGAHLYCIDGQGGLADEPREEFARHIGTPPSAASRDDPRREEILFLDFSSQDTAAAKVAMLAHGVSYTDYLSLARIGGRWRIVSKLYSGVPDAQ